MLKYSIAILIGCLYVAGVARVVSDEGRAHRATLSAAAATPPEPGHNEPSPSKGPADEREPAPVPESHEAPAPVVAPGPEKQAAEPLPPLPAPVEPGPKAPANPPPAPHWADALDLSFLKPEEELRLGRELHARILAEVPVLGKGDFLRRVDAAAKPFLAPGVRKDVPYTYTVLDSDAVNAFSHPGGYIYVCRGLFDLIADDEDYILEFVVGHEMAHLELRHALKLLERGNAATKERGIGTLQQFVLPIAMAYPDDQEFAADAWVYSKMIAADRTRHDALAFLKKFRSYAMSKDFPDGHKEPEPGSMAIENHFRAHTATWMRIKRLQEPAVPVKPAALKPLK